MKSALVGIVAAVMATAPVLALDGPGRALIAANTLQIANNPAQSATDGFVSRSFIPPYSGTVRVKWQVRSKDGTPVSAGASVTHLDFCTKISTSTAYEAQSCDIRVAGGVPITIWAQTDNSGNTVFLRFVSLSYKVVDSDGESIEWQALPPA